MRLGRLALQGLIVVILVGSAGLEADVYIGGSWQQPVEYWLNPNFEGEFVGNASDQLRELQCGVEAWFQQTGIDADLVYRGETDIAGFNSEDGINVTSWTPGDGGDALAGTIVSGEGDTIQGFDVVFFERFLETVPIRWSTAGEPSTGTIDIRGVATHEFGHVLGLGHSRDEDATMYPSARLRGLPLRSLSPIDRNCVEELYGHRGSPDPAPWIDDVLPSSGPSFGGNTVVLRGGNFTDRFDTVLTIGTHTLAPEDWSISGCGEIIIRAMPAGIAGPANIDLANSIGATTLKAGYIYEAASPLFLRGDANDDGTVDLSDGVSILEELFIRPSVGCYIAGDSDDDGNLTLTDAVYLFGFLFLGGDPLPPPAECGEDPTLDALPCREYSSCES